VHIPPKWFPCTCSMFLQSLPVACCSSTIICTIFYLIEHVAEMCPLRYNPHPGGHLVWPTNNLVEEHVTVCTASDEL
jgi:hypothetical protein